MTGKARDEGAATVLRDDAMQRRLLVRATALRAVRAFFDEAGFLECETPMLVPGPGLEPHIDPLAVRVVTTMGGAGETRYLHTSPELALKRVVAGGAGRVYQLARVFRDGERTARHLPEFTMLEWYRAGATLDALVDDTVHLMRRVAHALDDVVSSVVPARVHAVLARPVVRASTDALFRAHAGIDLRAALAAMARGDGSALVDAARARGMSLRSGADFEDAFFDVMGKHVEPAIGQDALAVVERWPAQMAVLARRCDDDPLFAERFEIYVDGLELCNAFDELTDAAEQRARFLVDNETRLRLGKPALPLDEDFLAALPRLPRTAGIALGFDRMLMWLTGAAHIDDVHVLPWR